MATFNWEAYVGSWTDMSTHTFTFSGTGGLTTPITVGTWQDESHLGSGDPPDTDECGGTHCNNVKYISSTQFDQGGGTETLSDVNLTVDECQIRIKFTHATSVATTGGRFYTFDGSTTTVEAVDIEAYAWEQGQTQTTWDYINDDTGAIGGDNAGERLDLGDSSLSQTHYFYIAISSRPESVGSKTEYDFGVALTYS